MSFLCTDTKGDLFRNYAGIAKECYGFQIAVLDLRNPTRSDGNMALMVDTYCVSNIKQLDGSYLLRIVDDGKPLRGARPVPPNLDDLFLHTSFQPSEGQP